MPQLWSCVQRLCCVVVCSAMVFVAGCHRNHIPAYSEPDELRFQTDEAKDLKNPRSDLAFMGGITVQGLTHVGGKEFGPLHLEHWQGEPLDLTTKGQDVVVVKTTAETRLNGKPLVVGQVLPLAIFGKGDLAGNWVTNGSISLHLSPRKEGPWLQVFDGQFEPLRSLHALNWYPPTPKYRVLAKWVPVSGERTVMLKRTNGGTDLPESVAGSLQFQIDGQKLQLYGASYPGLPIHVTFRDLTSKTETYPASRFLYINDESRSFDTTRPFDPKKPAELALDFNQAVNPPCAINPHTMCPIAPTENRLAVAIPAGEKRYNPESE